LSDSDRLSEVLGLIKVKVWQTTHVQATSRGPPSNQVEVVSLYISSVQYHPIANRTGSFSFATRQT
jgi:hypothetical protein